MTTILYLIGCVGQGKYKIAKQLEKEGFKIADNHLVNNPIFVLLDLDGGMLILEPAWDAMDQICTHVLDAPAQEHNHNYVLTNELLDREIFKEPTVNIR